VCRWENGAPAIKDFKRKMRRAVIPFLPVFVGLFCICLAARQEQGSQTPPPKQQKTADRKAAPPPTGSDGATDPAAMAGDKPSKDKPIPGGAATVEGTFIIGAEDILQIWVVQEPAISMQYTVRPDGIINVPLAGEIKAAGQTTARLEAAIAERLKANEIVNDPSVTVAVVQVRSRKYFISGNVNKPGEQYLVIPTRVSEALANAGGFRDFAKTKSIRVIRIMPDGQPKEFKYNDKDVSHGKKLEQNIFLEPGDHIYVD
jgi:polysaccharide export outer membrane protein